MRLAALCVYGILLAWSTTGGSDGGARPGDGGFGPCAASLEPEGPCAPGPDEDSCPFRFTLPPVTVHLPQHLRELEKIMEDLQKLKDNVDELRMMCADCTVRHGQGECAPRVRTGDDDDGGGKHGEERNWVHDRDDVRQEFGTGGVKVEKEMEGSLAEKERGTEKESVVKENGKLTDGKTPREKVQEKREPAKVQPSAGGERTKDKTKPKNQEPKKKAENEKSKNVKADKLQKGKEGKTSGNNKNTGKTEGSNKPSRRDGITEANTRSQSEGNGGRDEIKMSQGQEENTEEEGRDATKETEERGIKVEKNNEGPKQTEVIGPAGAQRTIKEKEEEEEEEVGTEIKPGREEVVQTLQRDSDEDLDRASERTDFASVSQTPLVTVGSTPRHDSADSDRDTASASSPSPPPPPSATTGASHGDTAQSTDGDMETPSKNLDPDVHARFRTTTQTTPSTTTTTVSNGLKTKSTGGDIETHLKNLDPDAHARFRTTTPTMTTQTTPSTTTTTTASNGLKTKSTGGDTETLSENLDPNAHARIRTTATTTASKRLKTKTKSGNTTLENLRPDTHARFRTTTPTSTTKKTALRGRATQSTDGDVDTTSGNSSPEAHARSRTPTPTTTTPKTTPSTTATTQTATTAASNGLKSTGSDSDTTLKNRHPDRNAKFWTRFKTTTQRTRTTASTTKASNGLKTKSTSSDMDTTLENLDPHAHARFRTRATTTTTPKTRTTTVSNGLKTKSTGSDIGTTYENQDPHAGFRTRDRTTTPTTTSTTTTTASNRLKPENTDSDTDPNLENQHPDPHAVFRTPITTTTTPTTTASKGLKIQSTGGDMDTNSENLHPDVHTKFRTRVTTTTATTTTPTSTTKMTASHGRATQSTDGDMDTTSGNFSPDAHAPKTTPSTTAATKTTASNGLKTNGTGSDTISKNRHPHRNAKFWTRLKTTTPKTRTTASTTTAASNELRAKSTSSDMDTTLENLDPHVHARFRTRGTTTTTPKPRTTTVSNGLKTKSTGSDIGTTLENQDPHAGFRTRDRTTTPTTTSTTTTTASNRLKPENTDSDMDPTSENQRPDPHAVFRTPITTTTTPTTTASKGLKIQNTSGDMDPTSENLHPDEFRTRVTTTTATTPTTTKTTQTTTTESRGPTTESTGGDDDTASANLNPDAQAGFSTRIRTTITQAITTTTTMGVPRQWLTSRFTSTTSPRPGIGFYGGSFSADAASTTSPAQHSSHMTVSVDRGRGSPKKNVSSKITPGEKPRPKPEKHKPGMKPQAEKNPKNPKNGNTPDGHPATERRIKNDPKQKPPPPKVSAGPKSKPGNKSQNVQIKKPEQRERTPPLRKNPTLKHDRNFTTVETEFDAQRPDTHPKTGPPEERPTDATGSGKVSLSERSNFKKPVKKPKEDQPQPNPKPGKQLKGKVKPDPTSKTKQHFTPGSEGAETVKLTAEPDRESATELMRKSDELRSNSTPAQDISQDRTEATPEPSHKTPPVKHKNPKSPMKPPVNKQNPKPGHISKLHPKHPDFVKRIKPSLKPKAAQTNWGMKTPRPGKVSKPEPIPEQVPAPDSDTASKPSPPTTPGPTRTPGATSVQRTEPAVQRPSGPQTRTDSRSHDSGTTSDGIQHSPLHVPPTSGAIKQSAEATHSPRDAGTRPSAPVPKTSDSPGLQTSPPPRALPTESPNSRAASDLRPQTVGQPPWIPMTTRPNGIILPGVFDSSGPGSTRLNPEGAATLQPPVRHRAEETPHTFQSPRPSPTPRAPTTSVPAADFGSTTPVTPGPRAQAAESSTPSARELRVKINQVAAYSKDSESLDVEPLEDKKGRNRSNHKLPSWMSSEVRRDCSDHLLRGETRSGLYLVTPDIRSRSFSVPCDMELEGGGWTLLQRRLDGSVSFNRTWAEYRAGFGEPGGGEFWLGNNMIHLLTRDRDMVLRVELEDFDGLAEHALYQHVRVASERLRYRLSVGGYSGTAGDALHFSRTYDHNHRSFTTPDRDNDRYPSGNCGAYYSSGWWFDACMASNLNGKYYEGRYKGVRDGIFWGTWHNISSEYYPTNDRRSFKSVRMMIRPKGFAP